MQKYTIVKFLENVEENYEFPATDWPLHMTIAGVFAVDWESTDLLQKLKNLLSKQKPIVVVADKDDYFGEQKQTQVTILGMTPELRQLHFDIVALLENSSAGFHESQYLGDGFKAHVTVQKQGRLHKGDEVIVDELSIVDMFASKEIGRRKVLQTIKFGGVLNSVAD